MTNWTALIKKAIERRGWLIRGSECMLSDGGDFDWSGLLKRSLRTDLLTMLCDDSVNTLYHKSSDNNYCTAFMKYLPWIETKHDQTDIFFQKYAILISNIWLYRVLSTQHSFLTFCSYITYFTCCLPTCLRFGSSFSLCLYFRLVFLFPSRFSNVNFCFYFFITSTHSFTFRFVLHF